MWGIGVATQKVNLNQVPLGRDINSLVLRNDGTVFHNNEEKNRLPANSIPQEGDIVGVTYDHVELNLYLNGKNMHCPASGIRGTVYPVVYVDDSAILDCQFGDFYHTPPQGFEKILFEQQIFWNTFASASIYMLLFFPYLKAPSVTVWSWLDIVIICDSNAPYVTPDYCVFKVDSNSMSIEF